MKSIDLLREMISFKEHELYQGLVEEAEIRRALDEYSESAPVSNIDQLDYQDSIFFLKSKLLVTLSAKARAASDLKILGAQLLAGSEIPVDVE